MATNDMVFDRNMNPVWCNTPESCRKWLRFHKSNRGTVDVRGYKVRTGWSHELLSVSEYLRRGREE